MSFSERPGGGRGRYPNFGLENPVLGTSYIGWLGRIEVGEADGGSTIEAGGPTTSVEREGRRLEQCVEQCVGEETVGA